MINVAVQGRVGVVELDRPERRNALDTAQCKRLVDAVATVVDEGVRAVVLTGSGPAFCAGADFDEVYDDGFRDALAGAVQAVADAPVPTIAAVNGPAIGGGTQLAIACDLRVADPSAVFAVPTAKLGLAVDPWTVRRLAQLAGGATARALLLGCERIDAPLAHSRGLADRIGDRAAAVAWATELAGLAPLTLTYSTLALDREEWALDDPRLVHAYETCWSSADREEGRAARLERRAPDFTGR